MYKNLAVIQSRKKQRIYSSKIKQDIRWNGQFVKDPEWSFAGARVDISVMFTELL